MSKKFKMTLALLSFLTILISCSVIGVLKHRELILSTRTIHTKIDIGGYKLNVNCFGKGKPTVIFESGYGCENKDWVQVQGAISKIARTFSYDRAGVGDSDRSELPRTSLYMIKELHTLLKNAKVKEPYVIVAHSFGGLNARLFAYTYPKEVEGIVFVDSTNPSWYLDSYKKKSKQEIEDLIKSSTYDTEGNYKELILSAEQVEKAAKKGMLRNIPIKVLGADHYGKYTNDKTWEKTSLELLSISNRSEYTLVKNSEHYIQIEHPKVVIDAIKEIIDEVKK